MIDQEREVVIYFWYGKPRLNAFSGILNLDRLQNKHKGKEPNFPEFPNLSVFKYKQNFKRHHKVNKREVFNTDTVLNCFNMSCLY